MEILKPRLKDAKLDKRMMKEMLVRLMYVEMLGHDASWGHIKALQAIPLLNSQKWDLPHLASKAMPCFDTGDWASIARGAQGGGKGVLLLTIFICEFFQS